MEERRTSEHIQVQGASSTPRKRLSLGREEKNASMPRNNHRASASSLHSEKDQYAPLRYDTV